MMDGAAAVEGLGEVDVECTHCKVKMSPHLGSGMRVRYFRCGSCHRWVSSTYADIFRADAKVRTRPEQARAHDERFEEVKARLERWLCALDEQDPYRVLGLSAMASPTEVRERFLELAFRNHPDRGGSAERMREVNAAYARILRHQEARPPPALPQFTAPRKSGLASRSR